MTSLCAAYNLVEVLPGRMTGKADSAAATSAAATAAFATFEFDERPNCTVSPPKIARRRTTERVWRIPPYVEPKDRTSKKRIAAARTMTSPTFHLGVRDA